MSLSFPHCKRTSAPPNNEPPPRQLTKLKVKQIASEIGCSTRQLARYAKKGVPGVEKGLGKYHYVWWDKSETLKWIEDHKRFKKGNRRQLAKRRNRLSKYQLFARLIRTTEKQVMEYLENALKKPTEAGLTELDITAQRLKRLASMVSSKVDVAHWQKFR